MMRRRPHRACSTVGRSARLLSQGAHGSVSSLIIHGQRNPAEWSGCDDGCTECDVVNEAGVEGDGVNPAFAQ